LPRYGRFLIHRRPPSDFRPRSETNMFHRLSLWSMSSLMVRSFREEHVVMARSL
jgi:hypothetical protein